MTGTEGELEALLGFLYAAPVGLIRTRDDGTIEIVNGAAMRLMLPIVANPATLSNLFDGLAPVAPDLRALVHSAGRATGPLLRGRRICLQGPGQRSEAALHAELSLYRLDDLGLMAVLADVTDSARAEQLLQAGEARLRFVLDAAAIGDWELDLDTGDLRVQGPFARCLGQAEVAVPWSLDRLMRALHDEDRDAAYAAFDHALLTGGDWRFEARLAAGGAAREEGGRGCRGCLPTVRGVVHRTSRAGADGRRHESDRRIAA